MPRAKDHAIDLYMTAIRDGRAREALDANIGERYIQHSTGVKDGKEGFLEFFQPFLERNPVREMEVIRALQDGSKVFLHVSQNLNDGEAKWVTADFFESDENGKIIEHWDVIAPFRISERSGHSNVDGERTLKDIEKTEENKSLVADFVEKVLVGGQVAELSRYVSDDGYVEHAPDFEDGIAAVDSRLRSGALRYDALFMLVGEGNFVATLCRASSDGQPVCQADVFRVHAGTIVEHWGDREAIPPKAEWANSGKF